MKVNDKKNTSVNPIGLDSAHSCERHFGCMSGLQPTNVFATLACQCLTSPESTISCSV